MKQILEAFFAGVRPLSFGPDPHLRQWQITRTLGEILVAALGRKSAKKALKEKGLSERDIADVLGPKVSRKVSVG